MMREVDRIAQVRRFNRIVTQQVGALSDRYLARDRSLGESRLLWEIGEDGCELRRLRSRLELDSGYLSRMLRSLEADGLVRVAVGASDRRVRRAELTARGKREWALLDRRSDELAAALISGLDDPQQERLVAAMREVEQLLTAPLVRIERVDPADETARWCLRHYVAELDHRFGDGFDPGLGIPAPDHELRPPAGAFVVAALHGEPVGCGAIKLPRGRPAYIKRMWVAQGARGLGLGRRLLEALEEIAVEAGARTVTLETNRALTEAIALYHSAGYREVAAFNDERYADHWFEKELPIRTSPRARRRTPSRDARSRRARA